ncbi:spermidine synthase [Opitutaceae bacterium TAV1]|nr:spermidine synthase [Opitutaceae bacterium TAV1]
MGRMPMPLHGLAACHFFRLRTCGLANGRESGFFAGMSGRTQKNRHRSTFIQNQNQNQNQRQPASAAAGTGALNRGLHAYLLLTACVTGASVMIVEILGARMLAPYIGTSHFVWTAQIGVTLVALAAGYALGGWFADRAPRPSCMFAAILLAALLLAFTVLACRPVALACLRLALAPGSLLASAFLFFPPLLLLGMVPPFLVRLLTVSLDNVGISVGRLSAISTLGSVAGTIAVGYLLVPFFPNSGIMCGTAGALSLLALGYFAVWRRRHIAGAALLTLATAGAGVWGSAYATLVHPSRFAEVFRANSNFGLMEVVDDRETGVRYYLNDLLVQNSHDPATDRSDALFTYMLHGLARAYTPQPVSDVLCIGMGVGIVPMQFAREGAGVDVVEINPAVLPLAREYFGFDPAAVRVHIGDGRRFIATPGRLYDTIILDAFLGESPPSHLMTREALAAMKARLKPGGTLVINTFGSFRPGRDFSIDSLDLTLAAVFATVRVHPDRAGGGSSGIFVVATDTPDARPLRRPDFADAPPRLRTRALAALDAVHVFGNKRQGIVLTDDYNPVDYHDAANRAELRRRLALGMIARRP